jgi:hypothetical protein
VKKGKQPDFSARWWKLSQPAKQKVGAGGEAHLDTNPFHPVAIGETLDAWLASTSTTDR